MMKASSGPSPAPWRFRRIAKGTVVIEHPGKAAPARAAPGTDCATQEGRSPTNGCFRRAIAYRRKHSSESERRRGIANQPANSFQIVNIPISSHGPELL